MLTEKQYREAIEALERMAKFNESAADLLHAIQDDLTEHRQLRRTLAES